MSNDEALNVLLNTGVGLVLGTAIGAVLGGIFIAWKWLRGEW